jgi:hypothetical protein
LESLVKLALALFLIAFAASPRPDGSIVGSVTDSWNVPIPFAHVDVTDDETGKVVGRLSRTDGRFTVLGLVVGHRYSILTRSIGFAPQRLPSVEAEPIGAGAPAIFKLAPIGVQLSARTH